MAKEIKLGPTGDYPEGSLGPMDHGGLQMGVAHDAAGNVHMNFGTMVDWIAMPKAQAVQLAVSILKHAGITKIELTHGDGSDPIQR